MHLIRNPRGAGSLLELVFVFWSILACSGLVSAALPTLNLQDANSIKGVSSRVAFDMMSFYNGNETGQTPGIIPDYYQWEAGAMLMTMIDYFYYTGDSTYNDEVMQGMLWQAGPLNDYMTPNQSHVQGNDDQGFWGLAAMSAAEQGFPAPPPDKPQWLELAQGVFETQAARWDMSTCKGGLRWQIFSYMAGYDYKSTIANGVFFNLAARLALYTGNDTYAQWANKAYDWTTDAGFITSDYIFYDGAHITTGCTDVKKYQWSYNIGVFMHGAATMYSYTKSSDIWKKRVDGILKASSVYLSPSANNVVYEVSCEPHGTCTKDNFSFKSYLIRWMAATTKLAPFTRDAIMPMLQATAKAAVAQCQGGPSTTMCGMKWTDNGKWDGTTGVGQQMGVLEAVTANLIDAAAPVDSKKNSGPNPPRHKNTPPLSSSDKSSPSRSPDTHQAGGANAKSPSAGAPGASTTQGQIASHSASASPPANQVSSAPSSPTSPPALALSNVTIPCTTCAGGSTLIAAPSAAASQIQKLASVSGLAVAQSAAARAIATASAAGVQAAKSSGGAVSGGGNEGAALGGPATGNGAPGSQSTGGSAPSGSPNAASGGSQTSGSPAAGTSATAGGGNGAYVPPKGSAGVGSSPDSAPSPSSTVAPFTGGSGKMAGGLNAVVIAVLVSGLFMRL